MAAPGVLMHPSILRRRASEWCHSNRPDTLTDLIGSARLKWWRGLVNAHIPVEVWAQAEQKRDDNPLRRAAPGPREYTPMHTASNVTSAGAVFQFSSQYPCPRQDDKASATVRRGHCAAAPWTKARQILLATT